MDEPSHRGNTENRETHGQGKSEMTGEMSDAGVLAKSDEK
jgi:hypothetical protein